MKTIRLKKIILPILLMTCLNLTGCASLNRFIGLPTMQIDDSGLGDNDIGKILKDANVWAITFTYKDGGDSTNPKDKVYPLIKQFIDTHKTLNDNIINALNQSKLGVSCQKNYCSYSGYYYRTAFGNNKAVVFKSLKERGDFNIHFDPNSLENTYHIDFKSHTVEVK